MEDLALNMENLQEEINKAIAELATAKDLDERIRLSKLIKNLAETMAVFFGFASDMLYYDMDQPEGIFDEEE